MWRLLEKGLPAPFSVSAHVLRYEIVVVGDAFWPDTASQFAKHRVGNTECVPCSGAAERFRPISPFIDTPRPKMTRSICKALARPSSALLFLPFLSARRRRSLPPWCPTSCWSPRSPVPLGKGIRSSPPTRPCAAGISKQAAAFQARLREEPADPAALLGMSAVAQGQGKGEAALAWMRRAPDGKPQNPGCFAPTRACCSSTTSRTRPCAAWAMRCGSILRRSRRGASSPRC